MVLPKSLRYSALIFSNLISPPNIKFTRVPEPSSITDEKAFVDDYNKAASSIMMLPYVYALNTINKILDSKEGLVALDLCCGPGHFTNLLASLARFEKVSGVDLSSPMLEYAKENALKAGPGEKAHFLKKDVTSLIGIEDASVDLTTFMNGAHHFSSISDVEKVLLEAERVTKPDGLIFVMDPVRQKNRRLSDSYFEIAGEDYVKKGMEYFNTDFYNSILASWRPDEFKEAVPKESKRNWVQIIPFGVPTFQLLIGLPQGREQIYLSKGLDGTYLKSLIAPEYRTDWKLFNLTFKLGKTLRLRR